ncbi:hypothetical protein QYE76_070344 [Lolium multiflorum]|uniref:Transposase (putative) gypsy type domain-containing protein n=1 Tax=Lolium multiflorum TaxID=4521 RepID=A0AAD8SJ21_LOLMU|nr:hypothetical protein QYE76_070344 [Lolium multiflorum]
MAAEDLEWERSKISNQDMNLLKRLGFTKKKDALRFPREESYPKPPMEYRVSFVDHLIRGLSPPIHEFLRGLLFVYGLQLHQLTPNSILHVSIFITLCECFLGVQPNWALWKRIFCLRRNGSHGVAYNIGGVVICVRSDVDYFDVKFPDSVQGWRKRWLYVHEESSDSMEYNIAPFDGKAKILRRRSWDAEASEEEKLATEALVTRIRELQTTRGKELSGIQITAYFLRIRMQPLQARKNPLWMYAGDEDVERLSTDLSAKDLEKLIRRISKLSKKDTIPTSCKVAPFCRANPLPEGHLVLSSLPPLPEGGEVEERAVVTDDNQGVFAPKVEPGIPTNLRLHLKKRLRPKFLRRRAHLFLLLLQRAKGKGMKPLTPASPKLILPVPKNLHLMPRKKLWIFTVLHSSAQLVRFGTQFIGYRDYARELEEKLAEANKRADALAIELEHSESTHTKTVEDLEKRLGDAKRALEENVAQHSAREEEILSRLETQSRCFVRRTHQEYELENPEDDELLDALSLLEIHGTEARNGLDEAEAGLSRLFPYFFHKKEQPATFIDLAQCFNGKEDLGLQLRQEGLKLIFDNYTTTPGPSEVFPSSHLRKTPVSVEFIENSSSKSSAEDLEELRQQLQSMKKQTLAMMEQSRKASEQEKLALQHAKEAMVAKDTAVLEAKGATTRENSMLELMLEASTDMLDKTLLDTTCSGSFTSNKEEFKRDLLDRIKENAEDWENDKGYADKPPFKPLPPKEGNEEKEEKKKKKKGTKKKKKKKKENKKKEVTAYPRVNEITLGNRKYVAPNNYYDNESEYDDLPIPFTHISDHDLDEHAAFDIENLFGTDYESNDDSIIHVPLNDDIESPKLGDAVLEDPIFETSTFSENDDITYSGLVTPSYGVVKTFPMAADLPMKLKLSTLSESLLIKESADDSKDVLLKILASFPLALLSKRGDENSPSLDEKLESTTENEIGTSRR